jgi:preprotein translocase subunit SecD
VFVPGASGAAAIDRLVRRGALSVRKVDERTSSAEIEAGIVHAGTEILPSDSPGEPRLAVWKQVIVTDDDLAAAKPGFSQSGAPIVNVRLNEAGTRRFATATRTSIGQRLAIVLDGHVLTAPTVMSPIEEGEIQISGHFTAAEARDLADMLAPSTTPRMDVVERGVVPGR